MHYPCTYIVHVVTFICQPYKNMWSKIIQWRCRDGMHHAINHNKEIPLAILSSIPCVTIPTYMYMYFRQRVTFDSIAKGISLFSRFFAWCILSLHVHPHSFDFCTCIVYTCYDNNLRVYIVGCKEMCTCTCVYSV